MPSKKGITGKVASNGTKKGTYPGNVSKPEKIALSFTANANLCESGTIIGNNQCVWISKPAMIKCGLSYGDTVIIQTSKEGNRIFCSKSFYFVFDIAASVQLQKGLKESEVVCSDSLFRCLSPSMSVIPVTVFRLTPSSTIYPASKVILSVIKI